VQLNNDSKKITLGIDENGNITYTDSSNVVSFAITTTSVTSANLDTSILSVDKGGTGVGSLAVGQLLVGNGTNDVLQNSNLKWDNTNRRLGIGTSNPSSKLEVYDGDIKLNTNWVNGATMNLYGYSSNKRLEFSYDDGTAIYDDNKFRFLTGASHIERMVVASDGNVGIGTSTPLKKLHVVSSNNNLVRIEADTNASSQVSGIEFGIPSYSSEKPIFLRG
jgi:hypothetical protein